MYLLISLSMIFQTFLSTFLNGYSAAVITRKTYTVYLKSDKIGKLTVSKTVNGTETKYALCSDVTVNILFDYTIVEKIDEIFKDANLHSSVHTRHVNKSIKANNKAQRTGAVYKLYCDNKCKDSLKQWITQTALTVYFKKPSDNQMIYSQNYQKMIAIKKKQTDVFELSLPDGKKVTYKYSSDKLKTVESGSALGTIKFVLD